MAWRLLSDFCIEPVVWFSFRISGILLRLYSMLSALSALPSALFTLTTRFTLRSSITSVLGLHSLLFTLATSLSPLNARPYTSPSQCYICNDNRSIRPAGRSVGRPAVNSSTATGTKWLHLISIQPSPTNVTPTLISWLVGRLLLFTYSKLATQMCGSRVMAESRPSTTTMESSRGPPKEQRPPVEKEKD